MDRNTDLLESIDEDAILAEQVGNRQLKKQQERALVLRVYNYYRVILSFLLLIVFWEVPNQLFVGALEPGLFQSAAMIYLAANVASSFFVLVRDDPRIVTDSLIAALVILDLFFLSALLLASGGVESGLSYLLIFSVAFGAIMLQGRLSMLFAAIATVCAISVEYYLHATGATSGNQHYFEIALLSVVFFLVDFLFQYVANLITERDLEVVSLEALGRIHHVAEQSRQELEISNSRFQVLLESTGEGVLGIDMVGAVSFANPRACQLLDIDYKALIGSDVQRFMIQADVPDESAKVVSIREQKILSLLDLAARATYDPGRWQTAAGDPFIIEYSAEATINKAGERTGAVLLFQNITQQRENEERVEYLANFDELTGLANRTNFNGVLKSAIRRNVRGGRYIGILIIDTDHFTVINEKLGQETGDEMLRMLAERLKNLVRPGDMVARLHGDQFAIMLVDMDHPENAAIVAEKIHKEASDPIQLDDRAPVTTSVSIGIAVTGADDRESDELISAAISALEIAKSHGRNTYRFFQPEMQKKAEEKKRVQMMLRSAIDNDEFHMVYQPIISLRDEKIATAEALIRWNPPDADAIRPDIFIPIAEESGQINNIGDWVLESVARQIRTWQEQLGVYPSVAINVSSKQLRSHEFRERFQDLIKRHNLPLGGVELELTETGVMEDPQTTLDELVKLHDLGVSISIDDFGTGYSSLDYLRRLPLDILKIDQSFTFGIGESEHDEEIVRVMIRMAHAMGLKVICEGVETKEHLQFLKTHDCDYVQGYYFSKPLSVDDMTGLLMAEQDGSLDVMSLPETA